MSGMQAGTAPVHELSCMEVWGGSAKTDQALSVPGLDIYVRSRVHQNDAGGGDLYYISMCGAGKIARLALADVSGHGAEASELARFLTDAMRRSINTPDQTRLAQILNKKFDREGGGRKFATAILSTYFQPSGHLILVNAGHPPPLIRKRGETEWRAVTDDHPDLVHSTVSEKGSAIRNLPLGIIGETSFTQSALPVDVGDTVLVYSDACIENSDAHGRQLGVDGFRALVEEVAGSCPLETLPERISVRLGERRVGEPDDDETVIVLHGNGQGTPPQSIGERLRTLGRIAGFGKLETGPGVNRSA